jgi:hypothetical protein
VIERQELKPREVVHPPTEAHPGSSPGSWGVSRRARSTQSA